jgi:hypothetical protein
MLELCIQTMLKLNKSILFIMLEKERSKILKGVLISSYYD